MIGDYRSVAAALCLSFAGGVAQALPPDQIFDRVAPGVWSVKAYSADEKLLASASGIVVAPGKVVTSCHVLARARQVQLRRGNTIFDAKLEFPDVERDLCQLDVPGLTAPAPTVGPVRTLRLGQRLYVVGFGRGNEQSIGEGLVSAVSEAGTGKERIQTTVPASPGLRGAGVFDEEARLVGVVTPSPADAAATAFAVPADWLGELAARGQAALAARAKPPAAGTGVNRSPAGAAAPGLPAPGTTWVYGFIERLYTRRQVDITVNVLSVNGSIVEEAVLPAGAPASRRVVNAADMQVLEVPVLPSTVLVEPTPYLPAAASGKGLGEIIAPVGYPAGGFAPWVTHVQVGGWDRLTVPGGTFNALRLEISGRRQHPPPTFAAAARYTLTAWYAPDIQRLVKLEHRVWSHGGKQIGEDILELLSYRPPS